MAQQASKTVQITVGELDESADQADNEDQDKGKKPKKNARVRNRDGHGSCPADAGLARAIQYARASPPAVAVIDVKDNSEAAKRGVTPGDVIIDVNSVPVKTAADLKKAFDAARKQGRKFALVKWRAKRIRRSSPCLRVRRRKKRKRSNTKSN